MLFTYHFTAYRVLFHLHLWEWQQMFNKRVNINVRRWIDDESDLQGKK